LIDHGAILDPHARVLIWFSHGFDRMVLGFEQGFVGVSLRL
jgi:hypothetical protein